MVILRLQNLRKNTTNSQPQDMFPPGSAWELRSLFWGVRKVAPYLDLLRWNQSTRILFQVGMVIDHCRPSIVGLLIFVQTTTALDSKIDWCMAPLGPRVTWLHGLEMLDLCPRCCAQHVDVGHVPCANKLLQILRSGLSNLLSRHLAAPRFGTVCAYFTRRLECWWIRLRLVLWDEQCSDEWLWPCIA